jgi:hypothetical protein
MQMFWTFKLSCVINALTSLACKLFWLPFKKLGNFLSNIQVTPIVAHCKKYLFGLVTE